MARDSGVRKTEWDFMKMRGDDAQNARVWNMHEGSYDQREAIFAPTPATLGFKMTPPPGARLRVAPALADPARTPTRFDVNVIDAAGASHNVSST